jgi:hypothetical protein
MVQISGSQPLLDEQKDASSADGCAGVRSVQA